MASITKDTHRTDHELVYVGDHPPNLSTLVDFVRDNGAGAIATFTGTTRNTFTINNTTKDVLLLSYTAYTPMAIRILHKILQECRTLYPSIVRLAVAHRLGDVPVGGESVLIAVSSPHRRDALMAVAWVIDELKRRVPIWKLETYADGSVWKENPECQWRSMVPA